jgi:hypothetical protein
MAILHDSGISVPDERLLDWKAWREEVEGKEYTIPEMKAYVEGVIVKGGIKAYNQAWHTYQDYTEQKAPAKGMQEAD